MKVVNSRIDMRLIHGQVAVMWTRSLNATRIMVVDNDVIHNNLEMQMLKMACPAEVKLSILDTVTAAKNLSNQKYVDDNVFIIAKTPLVYLELAKNGYVIDKLTVGNMAKRENTRQIFKTALVTPQEEDAFIELEKLGTKIEYQLVNTDNPIDFMSLLKAQ